MGFVTIRKYLYADLERGGEPDAGAEWPRFMADLLESVSGFMIAGEDSEAAQADLAQLRNRLLRGGEQLDLGEIQSDFSRILQEFGENRAARETARQRELAGLLGVLNDALLFAGSSAERAASFTTNLETTLRKATRTQDIRSLHANLSEVMSLVREEARHQNETGTQQFAAISKRAQVARRSVAPAQEHLGTREESLDAVKQALLARPAELRWYSALFVIERLRVIRRRYGDEVAADLVENLVHKMLKPLAEDGSVFLWTPETVLLLFTHKEDRARVREELASKVTGTFEHRANLGTRSASLSVGLRWVTAPVEGVANDFILIADRFAEGV